MMKNYECDTGDEHHEKCEMSRYQLSKRWMIEDIYNTAIDNDVRYDWVKVLCLIVGGKNVTQTTYLMYEYHQ